MFFPLFLFTTVILSLVSVTSLSTLKDQDNTAKLMASNAAFYAAESSLEESLYEIKQNKVSDASEQNSLNRSFALEKSDIANTTGKFSLNDYEIAIVERSFDDAPDLLDSYGGFQSFDEFRFIDVENIFTSLEFHYHKTGEIFDDGILIDVIQFPRVNFESSADNTMIDFGSVRNLSTKTRTTGKNICRYMYNTLGNSGSGATANPDVSRCTNIINISQSGSTAEGGRFHSMIKMEAFDLSQNNYIIRFRTIKNEAVHYEVQAVYNGENTKLALTNQVLEIDSETATNNMFQRVKQQQRSFAPLQPGLDFVLFSNEKLSK